MKVKLLSRVRLFATPWTVAYQASLSMGFSRQEYWSGLPFPWWRICLPMQETQVLRFWSLSRDVPLEEKMATVPVFLPEKSWTEVPGTRLHCQWDFPCKNTGVDWHSLLQGSSQSRNQTQISCTAGRFFTSWATREAFILWICILTRKVFLRVTQD